MFSWLGGADSDTVLSENRPPSADNNVKSAGSTTLADDDASYYSEPECDYDRNATQLYKLIESKKWDAALQRVHSCPEEARTWVCRRERAGASAIMGGMANNSGSGEERPIRWRLLPLHATCVFRSPLSLIEALVEAYPDGTQMKDVS